MSLLVLILVLIGSFYFANSWETNSKYCSKIYSNENYSGNFFVLKDNQHVSEFQEIVTNQKPWKNTTNISFQVNENCTLFFKNRNGDKFDFEENIPNIDAENIKSFSCSCDRHCNCTTIHFKQNECARAFLWKDCSHCNAVYTTLNQGKSNFPETLSTKVNSIAVKHGCNLTVNDQFQIQRNHEMSFLNQTLKTYSCVCDSKLKVNNIEKDTDNSGKNLMDMPNSRDRINSKLSQETLKGHSGLIAGLQSLNINRSPKNAYILLLGLTGGGKSSTINFLFDNPSLTQVGNSSSTTTSINEFQIPVTLRELGLRNTQLRIIDTPGISDTRGISKDAQYLATLDDYLKKHEDLKIFKPNIILIVANFQDNRYAGESSKFVKMLRTIELFQERIIDHNYSNVIFVFTHFMSEVLEVTRNPSEKLESIKKVIQEYTTLPNPINIVVAENKPEAHNLLGINGFFKLPNGEFYPENLFTKIQSILIHHEDTIGSSIIKSAFRHLNTNKIRLRSTNVLSEAHPKTIHYLAVLARLASVIETTEVSRLLNDVILEDTLEKKCPDCVQLFKRYCYRKGIYTVDDIPRTTNALINFLQGVPINPVSLKLLEALNITFPNLPGLNPIGHGYNLFQDKVLAYPILESSIDQTIYTEFGYQIPGYTNMQPSNFISPVFKIMNSKEEYVFARWNDLNQDSSHSKELNPQDFKGEIKHGYNIVSQENPTKDSLTALIEYNLMELKLNNNFNFSDEFIQSLQNLEYFRNTDWKVVSNWKTFFDKYGTHVVKRTQFGGSIRIVVKNANDSLSNMEKFGEMNEGLQYVVNHIANSFIGKELEAQDIKLNYSIFFRSGEMDVYEYNNLSSIGSHLIQNWKTTLKVKPTLLDTYFDLVPISELFQRHYKGNNTQELLEKFKQAEFSLFNASLVYVPVSNLRVINTRDNVGIEEVETDHKTLAQFAEMFKTLHERSERMQKETLRIISEFQGRAVAEDEAYEQSRQLRLQEEKIKEEELVKEENEKQNMQLAKEQMEQERRTEEMNYHLQLEEIRRQAEIEKNEARSKMEQEQFATLVNFLAAENERIAEANKNKKHWYDYVMEVVPSVTSVVGLAAAAG